MVWRALAALSLLALTSCGAALIGVGAGLGTVGGSLALADQAVRLAGDTLSLDAKLACALQTYANHKTPPDPQLSYWAGLSCRW